MGNTGYQQIDLPGGAEDAVKPVGILVNAGIKERIVSVPTKDSIVPVAVGRFKNNFRSPIMFENQLILFPVQRCGVGSAPVRVPGCDFGEILIIVRVGGLDRLRRGSGCRGGGAGDGLRGFDGRGGGFNRRYRGRRSGVGATGQKHGPGQYSGEKLFFHGVSLLLFIWCSNRPATSWNRFSQAFLPGVLCHRGKWQ